MIIIANYSTISKFYISRNTTEETIPRVFRQNKQNMKRFSP